MDVESYHTGGIYMSEVTVNKEHKDRLFNYIFGSEENREWTLSLYNAVNGSHYTQAKRV